MKKSKTPKAPKDSGSMLNQKTNEDFNKKPPVPDDFKEEVRGKHKGHSLVGGKNKNGRTTK